MLEVWRRKPLTEGYKLLLREGNNNKPRYKVLINQQNLLLTAEL